MIKYLQMVDLLRPNNHARTLKKMSNLTGKKALNDLKTFSCSSMFVDVNYLFFRFRILAFSSLLSFSTSLFCLIKSDNFTFNFSTTLLKWAQFSQATVGLALSSSSNLELKWDSSDSGWMFNFLHFAQKFLKETPLFCYFR